MTDKEHERLFKIFTEWKVCGFRVLKELNKNNIEETKVRVLEFRAFHKEKWEKYSGDHNLSGELIDLLRAISQIETKIKELEENQ
jgi:hypothetical protein